MGNFGVVVVSMLVLVHADARTQMRGEPLWATTATEAELKTALYADGDDVESPLIPSAEQVAAARQAWSRRILAADKTEAQLQQRLRAAHRPVSTRRNLQSGAGDVWEHMWKYDSSVLSGSMAGKIGSTSTLGEDERVLGFPTGSDGDATALAMLRDSRIESQNVCEDPLALNEGEAGGCEYDCDSLKEHFFSGTPNTRCFLYAGGWPSDMMSMRRDRLDWDTFLAPTVVGSEAVNFVVGEGANCINVTIQTSLTDAITGAETTHSETRCMPPGVHVHNHTVTEPHSIEVVGYDSTRQGDRTEFTVGDCIDVLIRIETNSQAQVTWTLSLDGDDHNGPWSFSSTGSHEFISCMFENRYVLTIEAGDEGWSGTVEVVSFVPDKTIEIRPDENWVIQGREIDNVPTTLDARLKSGAAYPREDMVISYASLVIRYVRFTSQQATLDRYEEHRTHSLAANARLGGALDYTGGWGQTLIFEHCVFDHLFATSGGAIFIDGQMDEFARMNPQLTNEALTLVISNCLFWENQAPWVGGGARIVDVMPLDLTIVDTQFIDNYATISSGINWALYSNSFDEGTGVLGRNNANLTRIELTQLNTFKPAGPFGGSQYEQGPLWLCSFPAHWNTKDDHPEVGTDVHIERLLCHDIQMVRHACSAVVSGEYTAGFWNTTIVDTEFRRAFGTQQTSAYATGAYLYWSDALEVRRTKFDTVGFHPDAEEVGIGEGVLFVIITEIARLVNVEVTNSIAAKGTAAAFTGSGSAEIINCLFHGNVAWQAGGALYHTAAGALLVQGTSFLNNQVSTNRTDLSVQIVVTVYTGALGRAEEGVPRPTDNLQMAELPVWKLDGQMPSNEDGSCGMWNCTLGDEIIYGGVEYVKHNYYSTVVTTTPGYHRLWHGIIVNIPDPATHWKGGWIAIRDTLDKITPAIDDNRVSECPADCSQPNSVGLARQPQCYMGTTAGNADTSHEFCRGGQAFWSYTDITVPYGRGGAIAVQSNAPVEITDSTFSSNTAGYGKELAVEGSDRLVVSNTSFLPGVVEGETSSNTLFLDAVTQSTCAEAPCALGQRCSFRALSIFCSSCQLNQIGDGRECTTCQPGKEPDVEQVSCQSCAGATYSTIGVCFDCPAGETNASGHGACTPCPAGQARPSTAPSCEPCLPGYEPADDRSSCQPCGMSNQVSQDGSTCEECPPGKQPNANQTECDSCTGNQFSTAGICNECPAGTTSTATNSECTACPSGRARAAGTASCQPCQPGYEPTTDRVACASCAIKNQYSVDGTRCEECESRKAPSSDFTECLCASGTFDSNYYGSLQCHGAAQTHGARDDTCLECPHCMNCDILGQNVLLEGWAFYGSTTAYPCPAPQGCPQQMLKPRYNHSVVWKSCGNEWNGCPAVDAQCAEGYRGPTCAMCEPEWNHYKVGLPCDSCDDGRVNVPMLVGLSLVLLLAAATVISGAYAWIDENRMMTDAYVFIVTLCNLCRPFSQSTEYSKFVLESPRSLCTIVFCGSRRRIMISLCQILGQADTVLSITFPDPIPTLMDAMRLLFLDLRKLIRMDCWQLGGLYTKLATNLFLTPIVLLGAAYIYYMTEARTVKRLIAEGVSDDDALKSASMQLQRNAQRAIFMLCTFASIVASTFLGAIDQTARYTLLCGTRTVDSIAAWFADPMMTTTLFRVFQCRELGDQSYHEDDYDIMCDDGTFQATKIFVAIGIIAVPIGIPLSFWSLMRSKVQELGGQANVNAYGGAKLAADDEDDDTDRFSFLVSDYRPEYWQWEIVSYGRKLTLTGWTVLVGRGTMGQIYFAMLTSALFLLWHVRAYPFLLQKHNVMETVGEVAVLLMYTTCLLLRNDSADAWSNEWVPREGYGWFLATLYVAIVPAPIFYGLWRQRFKPEAKALQNESESFEFDNPLAPSSSTPDESALQKGSISRAAQRELKELRQKVKTLQVQLQKSNANVSGDETGESQARDLFNTRRASQVGELKELAESGMITEESLQQAKDNLDSYIKDDILRQQSTIGSRAALRQFLASARLLHHEVRIVKVLGEQATEEDLEFLTEIDIQSVTSEMTRAEAERFKRLVSQASTVADPSMPEVEGDATRT